METVSRNRNLSMSLLDALLLDAHRIDIFVSRRTDGARGTGTQSDPYNANTDLNQDLFDTVMDSLPDSTPLRVHLGPGEYLTKGYCDGVAGGWQPKPGMKLVGSGVDVTGLRLIGAQNPVSGTRHYFLVGHVLSTGNPLMDYFEISDLTLDCDAAGQSGSSFACGGLRVMGEQARVRRVKVVHWGTKTNLQPCYAMALITADPGETSEQPAHTGFEECLAIEPYDSIPSGVPVHVFYVGPKAPPGTALEGEGAFPYIRNCYVDGSGLSLALDIRALSMGWCHNGIVEGNQIEHVGVAGPMLESATGWSMTIRDNFFHDVRRGPYLKLGQTSGDDIALSSLSFAGASAPYEVTATVSAAHNLKVGDRVQLVCNPSSLDGLVEVVEVTDSTHFKYYWPGASASLITGTMEKVFGTGRILIEGNLIELAPEDDAELAIEVDDATIDASTPDYTHGEVVIQSNQIRYADGLDDPEYTGDGIYAKGVKNLVVRDNVLAVAPENPVRDERCGQVNYNNNKTPAGTLIRGFKEDTDQQYDELETEAEDALVMALFKK